MDKCDVEGQSSELRMIIAGSRLGSVMTAKLDKHLQVIERKIADRPPEERALRVNAAVSGFHAISKEGFMPEFAKAVGDARAVSSTLNDCLEARDLNPTMVRGCQIIVDGLARQVGVFNEREVTRMRLFEVSQANIVPLVAHDDDADMLALMVEFDRLSREEGMTCRN